MNFQDRITQRLQERKEAINQQQTDNSETSVEQFEHSPYFGIEQLRNHPSCIDLRLTNGKFKALPYAYILEIDYDPSDGIEITATGKKVIVTGRNLKLLYHYLTAFRVRYIQANVGNDLEEEKALFVKNIKIDEM